MKRTSQKFTRPQLGRKLLACGVCSSWNRKLTICTAAALLFFAVSAHAQTDVSLPPMGGGGGGQFVARCPQGKLLAGVELRTGDDVDSIRPLCVTAYGPADVGPPVPGGIWFGGNGGGTRQLVCPQEAPIVTRIDVAAEGVDTIVVNNIHLTCGVASTQPGEVAGPKFDGPSANSTVNIFESLKEYSTPFMCRSGIGKNTATGTAQMFSRPGRLRVARFRFPPLQSISPDLQGAARSR